MSKYDFEIDLSQNSSTGIILSKINKGAVVLEFGCATGRMTRYMKEILECQVYIVEYDKSAFEMALKYAEDGLCDDILNFQWVEKFKDIEFDAIIFADVLEHLSKPEKVLVEAAGLLKDTGHIYISIPNITHNDILLKAYEEHFDYTATGILDDTHVHFWGLRNIEMLSVKSGLNISNIEGTYCPTGLTEQYPQGRVVENILLVNVLKERQCGEVYQFILTLNKKDGGDVIHTLKRQSIKSHIYLDTGKGFNANEVIEFDAEYSGQGSYSAHYVINDIGEIQNIRFDPIEFQGCILQNISISQVENLPLIYQNAIELGEGLFLPGNDPMVCVNVMSKKEPVVIDADIIILGEKYIQSVQDAFVDRCAEFNVMQGKMGELTLEKNELQTKFVGVAEEYEKIRREKEYLSVENEGLCKEVERLVGEAARLNGENEELRRNIGSYIVLVNNKDKFALEIKQALNAKGQYVQELEQILSAKNQYIQELEAALNYYKNLRVVRLRAFIVRILKGVIRRLKRVLGKEEH